MAEAAPVRPHASGTRSQDALIRRFGELSSISSVGLARALAAAVVRGWWAQSLINASSPGRWALRKVPSGDLALSADLEREAVAIGGELASLAAGEASAGIGRLYTHCLPSELRAKQGIFYTPGALVSFLLNRAEAAGHTWDHGRVIDPSCGGGAFLVEAARRMMQALDGAHAGIAVRSIGQRLVGWDLDPFAAWLAQVSLDVLTLPLAVAAGQRLPAVAKSRDALTSFHDGCGGFDLVVGNPPFGKVKDTPEIRAEFARSLYGHPNVYGLFTDLALRLSKPNGLVAYLTPASFLAGQYFRSLRDLLVREAPPLTIDFVSSRKDVFDDVLQEIVLSVFRRGRCERTTVCYTVTVERSGLRSARAGTADLPSGHAPWMLPRHDGDAEMVAQAASMSWRLRDWGYRVSTGPLVWNRFKDRLFEQPGRGRVPVIWAEAVQAGGRFSLQAVRRGHKAWFAPGAGDAAMLVDQPCVLVQRTTSKEQERRIISAALPASVIKKHGAITVENHLNMVVPVAEQPLVHPKVLARFLASEVADRLLRCLNASVAVSASELEALPLPSPAEVIAACTAVNPEEAFSRLYGAEG